VTRVAGWQATGCKQREQVLLGGRVPDRLACQGAELPHAHVRHGSGAECGDPTDPPDPRAALGPSSLQPFQEHQQRQAGEQPDCAER
jgi:hypothetical protein